MFNSRSYLLRVEHDKLTENVFSAWPSKQRKNRDNKSKRKKRKRGTQKETLLHEIERAKKQAFRCINASMNNSEQ